MQTIYNLKLVFIGVADNACDRAVHINKPAGCKEIMPVLASANGHKLFPGTANMRPADEKNRNKFTRMVRDGVKP